MVVNGTVALCNNRRTLGLQSATGITKCDDYYKVRQNSVSKAREWPRGWEMPGPRAVQNLQMPHPRD